MYDNIYNTYVVAGVAKRLETPCFQDVHGNNVPEETKYGERIDIEMLHPN